MVGMVLGPQAIAGLTFANAYWQIGNRLSLGLSGGSISLVSQYYGAERLEIANRVILSGVGFRTSYRVLVYQNRFDSRDSIKIR